MNKKSMALMTIGAALALILGIWACGSSSSSSSGSSAADDDTSPSDDDTNPPDDDASPADDDDNDDGSPTDDDDDDNDDTSPSATWTDTNTHLMWQVEKGSLRDWDSALSYCTNLSLGGFGNWRLPKINDLRSIVAGCAATGTGGTCGVTNGCAAPNCKDSSCDGCTPEFGGPGSNGCFWVTELAGDCNAAFWSDTEDSNAPSYWWAVNYSVAAVVERVETDATLNVRCVRSTTD